MAANGIPAVSSREYELCWIHVGSVFMRFEASVVKLTQHSDYTLPVTSISFPTEQAIVQRTQITQENRLMRTGRAEEAGALAKQIGNDIWRRNKTHYSQQNADVKDVWTCAWKLTGRKQEPNCGEGITTIRYYNDLDFRDQYVCL